MRALLFSGVLWRSLSLAVIALHDAARALAAARASRPMAAGAFAENVMAVLGLYMLPFRTWWDQAAAVRAKLAPASIAGWPRDRAVIFAARSYVTVCVCFVVLMFATALYPLIGEPFGGWVVVSLLVTLQPSVESTVSRLAMRVLGTVLGCMLGYGIMYSPASADSPAILVFFLLVVIFPVMLMINSPYRYAAFVFCLR